MSVKKFKFVSPGIFLNEIDNSQLAREPEAVGPTIVGRTLKGPGMIPLRVDSMTQFIEDLEGPLGMVDCNISSDCVQIDNCNIRMPINKINDNIRNMFNHILVSDITSQLT